MQGPSCDPGVHSVIDEQNPGQLFYSLLPFTEFISTVTTSASIFGILLSTLIIKFQTATLWYYP